MVDVFSRAKRSAVMASVRGRDTRPEAIVFAGLRRHGLNPKRNDPTLPGTPDLVLPHAHVAVFVHGCFWHDHSCQRGSRVPATNVRYWRDKKLANHRRDAQSSRALRRLGWSVLVIWECALERGIRRVVQRLRVG